MFEFQPNRIGTVVDHIGEAVEHRNNSMEVAIAINRNQKYMKDIYMFNQSCGPENSYIHYFLGSVLMFSLAEIIFCVHIV